MKIIKTLISVAALVATTSTVFAAGTQAGTDIDNTASITYSVGGTAQAPIDSSEGGNTTPGYGNGTATTFVVDKKVDLLVTGATNTTVVPSASGATTEVTFTVKNEGNSDETFTLATTGSVTGGDDFNTSACTITSPASPVAIAQDIIQDVKVQCTIPANNGGTVSDGKTSLVDLLATANVAAETTGTDTAATEDVVYADDNGTATDLASGAGAVSLDGTRNASHSATNTYTIGTAKLSVKKESAVYSDPENGTTVPKRIPGALIKYTITIDNTAGSLDATGLAVSDYIPANMTYATTLTTPAAPANCVATGGGACVLDGSLVINGAAAANGISATGITVASGSSETVTFYASVD